MYNLRSISSLWAIAAQVPAFLECSNRYSRKESPEESEVVWKDGGC